MINCPRCKCAEFTISYSVDSTGKFNQDFLLECRHCGLVGTILVEHPEVDWMLS